MPVEFLTDEQAAYGCFTEVPTRPELERFFFLDSDDLDLVALRRTAQCSRTCPQPQGRASPQVRTLDLSAGPRYDQSLELSLAHR
jgi:hypothetical protein